MRAIDIEVADDPRLDAYRDVKDGELRRRRGEFMAEGRGILRCLVERTAFRPSSVLLGSPAFEALGDVLSKLPEDVPIYRAPRPVLESTTGFRIHRGCLAAVPRPPEIDPLAMLDSLPARARVVVMEGLTNHDNVGGLFRNAMAFGVDAVLLCPRCCDPLYRKAIRTSLGGSLCVPFAQAARWPEDLVALRDLGFRILALDPDGRESLRDCELLTAPRVALVVGTEGAGLSPAVREVADATLRIEMAPGVDSLNVATAAAIALHELHGLGSVGAAGRDA